ncbi:integrase core domain-containing protein [Sphingomonas sp. CFBP 13706]|uniref:integrase core domain-containing protein n=1 Tax=Sphingomonas sp. CFBP 13706 TaxID=2775314 RepID=UPI00406CE521
MACRASCRNTTRTAPSARRPTSRSLILSRLTRPGSDRDPFFIGPEPKPSPTDHAFAWPFNDRLRDEGPNSRLFLCIADARFKIAAWRHDYDESHHHASPGW